MSKMNTMEELEFLLRLQEQSLGINSDNDIEVYCKPFRKADDKSDKIIANIEINMKRLEFKKVGDYIEGIFNDGDIQEEVDKIIIQYIQKIIGDRIKKLRKMIIENLGINEKPEIRYKAIPNEEEEGGTTGYETNH